jgi:hypothetical protein
MQESGADADSLLCLRCDATIISANQGGLCHFHPGTIDTDLRCHGPSCGILADFWTCCGKEIGCYGSSDGKEFDDRTPVAGCQVATSHRFTEATDETVATIGIKVEGVAAPALPPSADKEVVTPLPASDPLCSLDCARLLRVL